MAIKTASSFSKNLFLIALITMVTVFLWIGLEVVRTSKKTTIPQPTQNQMRPLNSKIDPAVFSLLEEKIAPSKEELSILLQSQPAANQPSTDSSKISTESGSLDSRQEE
jgi:hypothetical protein